MSDTYEVDGVTIKTLGGGFYELSHPSLAEPVKERGKEAADERAAEIAKAAKAAEEGSGTIPAQGELPETPATDAKDGAENEDLIDAKDDQIAALMAERAEDKARMDKLEEMVRTVVSMKNGVDEDEDTSDRVPATIQRSFTGEMDSKTKAALKKAGIGVTTIILEENPDIPPTGLFLGHNFRSFMILPGEPVDVPDFLLSVLDDAITSSPVVDTKSQRVLGHRSRMQYSYRKV